jgi:GntR family transcriptional regulator
MWLPAGPFKGLTVEQLSSYPGAMYSLFESTFGVRMVRAEERIKATTPDTETAALLDVETQTPLLNVERIAYTYNNLPMELRRALYRTDTHHYKNELN